MAGLGGVGEEVEATEAAEADSEAATSRIEIKMRSHVERWLVRSVLVPNMEWIAEFL